jgi:hypothetical protein
MLGLLPFALTNLKSLVSPSLHATDASPTGAGSCVARQIKREPGACNPGDLLCGSCRKDMSEAMAVGRRWTAHSSAEGIFVRSDVTWPIENNAVLLTWQCQCSASVGVGRN